MTRTYYSTADLVKDAIENRDNSLTDAIIEEYIRQSEGRIDGLMQTTFRTVSTSGTASDGAVGSLTDTGEAWTINTYADYSVLIWSGTGAGQIRVIASNTADVLTVTDDFTTAPDATSKYEIFNFSEYNHGLIREVCTAMAALKCISFNTSRFPSSADAEFSINLLHEIVTFNLKLLLDKRVVDYLINL